MKLFFIGAGNMAGAICKGILSANLLPASNIYLYDKIENKYLSFDKNCVKVKNIAEGIKEADYIFLSIKPQNVKEVLAEIKNLDYSNNTFISICAGITIDSIESVIPNARIIRVMPNTPLLIGHGVTALAKNSNVTDDNYSFIKNVFSSSGITVDVQEQDIDAITAITSSSPAYIYLFIKSMLEGAQKIGFNNKETLNLICKTIIGSTNLVLQSSLTLDEQINMVKSPNGTTEKALNVLDNKDFTGTIIDAMQACKDRAKELAELNK